MQATHNKEKSKIPKLLTIRQFAEKHKFISESSIRWLIFKDEIKDCIYRLSRRIYIDEEKFFEVLKNRKENFSNIGKEEGNAS